MIRALLVVFALSSSSPAQAIDAPREPVPAHTLARVSVSGLEWPAFDVTPLSGDLPYDSFASGSELVFTGAPGRYKVLCLGLVDGKPSILGATVTIAGGPTPPAPLPPAPGPSPVPPKPTPVVDGVVWVNLLYDDAQLTPAAAAFTSDPSVSDRVRAAGGRWVQVEIDGEYARSKGLRDYAAQNGGLPFLLYQSPDGAVVWAEPATTVDALLGKIRALRGLQ